MANIDEELLSREVLPNQEEQSRAASKLKSDRVADSNGAAGTANGSVDNLTEGQRRAALRQVKDSKPAVPGESSANGASMASAAGLKFAWLNLFDSFGLTLIYINLHIFGHSVFGEKIFCELGEEWIPANMRANPGAQAVKDRIKTFGLIEKMILIFLDLLAFFALLVLLTVLVLVVAVFTGNFEVITSLGWEAIKTLLSLFGNI
jgi:hypothetical protein